MDGEREGKSGWSGRDRREEREEEGSEGQGWGESGGARWRGIEERENSEDWRWRGEKRGWEKEGG